MKNTKVPMNKVVVASRIGAIERLISSSSKVVAENWSEMFQWYREATNIVSSFDQVLREIHESVKKGSRTSEKADQLITRLISKDIQMQIPDKAPFKYEELFPEVPQQEDPPTIKQADVLAALGILKVGDDKKASVTADKLWGMITDDEE